MVRLHVNGQERQVDADLSTPILWVLRDQLGLTGAKFGCGVGACGACTVYVDGRPERGCLISVASVIGQKLTTVESVHAGRAPVGMAGNSAAWRAAAGARAAVQGPADAIVL